MGRWVIERRAGMYRKIEENEHSFTYQLTHLGGFALHFCGDEKSHDSSLGGFVGAS